METTVTGMQSKSIQIIEMHFSALFGRIFILTNRG